MYCHHRTHFLSGFMGLPAGHPHASANSLELESVPITLNLLGLCTPSTTRDFRAPRVEFPHHICKDIYKWFLLPSCGVLCSQPGDWRLNQGVVITSTDVRKNPPQKFSFSYLTLWFDYFNVLSSLLSSRYLGHLLQG